jgi:hypothetical protein
MPINKIASILILACGLALTAEIDMEPSLPPDTLKVSCPNDDPRLQFWCSRVIKRLEMEWSSQPQLETYKPDTLMLSFKAKRDGSLSNIRIESRSPNSEFRNKAGRLADGSFHLPPIPENYIADEISVSVEIRKGVSKDSSMARKREVALAKILGGGIEVIHDEAQNTAVKRKLVAAILKDTLALLSLAAGVDEPTTELQKKNFRKSAAFTSLLPKLDSITGSILGGRYALMVHNGLEDASLKSIVDQVFLPEGKSVVNPFGWGEETRGQVNLRDYDLKNQCLRVGFVGSLLIDEYLMEPRLFGLNGKKAGGRSRAPLEASKIKCGSDQQDCLEMRATMEMMERISMEESEASEPYVACLEMDEKAAAGLENNDDVDLFLIFRIKPKLWKLGDRMFLQSMENQFLVTSRNLAYQHFDFKIKPVAAARK